MRLGIDLGGSKTALVALSDEGIVLYEAQRPTPAHSYEAILLQISAMVVEAEQLCGQQGTVGIGTPGAISPATGLLKNSNTQCLNGKPFRQDISQQLGRDVRLANDADCFTLSEAVDGAAEGAASVFGVIIGTGTGGGICVHGRLLSGPNAIAGEWGHNPMPWALPEELPGLPCYCGKRGCIETWCSGPGLSRAHEAETQERQSAKDIARQAQQGSQRARESLSRYTNRLARALASVINLLDPEVIVLGGGLSQIQSLYEEIPKHWSQYVFSDTVQTRLVSAKYGAASGVRGAAWLWPNKR